MQRLDGCGYEERERLGCWVGISVGQLGHVSLIVFSLLQVWPTREASFSLPFNAH